MSRCSLVSRSLGGGGSNSSSNSLSPGVFPSRNLPLSIRIQRFFNNTTIPTSVIDAEFANTSSSSSSSKARKKTPSWRPRGRSRRSIIVEARPPVHKDRLHRKDEIQPNYNTLPPRRPQQQHRSVGAYLLPQVAHVPPIVISSDQWRYGGDRKATRCDIGGPHSPSPPAVVAHQRLSKTFQHQNTMPKPRASPAEEPLILMTVKGWNDDTIVHWMDQKQCPIGFSHQWQQQQQSATKHADHHHHWYRLTDQVLAATTATTTTPDTVKRALLPLWDRILLLEEENVQQHQPQHHHATYECWRTKFVGDNKTTTNATTVKQVPERFSRYSSSRYHGHTTINKNNRSALSLLKIQGWNVANATNRFFNATACSAAIATTTKEDIPNPRSVKLPLTGDLRAGNMTKRNGQLDRNGVDPTDVVATLVRATAAVDATTTTPTGRSEKYDEFEQALWQTTPGSVNRTFQLVDQWLLLRNEPSAAEGEVLPLTSGPSISVAALDWVVECWQKNSQFQYNSDNDGTESTASPEDVWERVFRIAKATAAVPSGTTLSRIIQTIGQIEEPSKAPLRAEALVQRYLEEANNKSGSDTHPYLNTTTVNSLLQLWYRSRLPESPAAADRWLQQLSLEWHHLKRNSATKQQRVDRIKPDDVTYATVIATWTAVAAPGTAVHRAEVLMRTFVTEQDEGEEQSSFMVIGTVVDALAKAGHVEHAHKLLNSYTAAAPQTARRPTETLEGCNPVLSILEAYRKRLDRQPAVVMAQMETFIQQMEILANKYEAWKPVFHPDAACYNVIIGAYTQLRMPQRAESLLGRIMRLHESNGHAFSVHSDSLQPSLTTIWNGVLEAWADSGDAETVPRAVALVKSMEKRYRNNSSVRPSTQTYNLLLHCLVHDRRNSQVDNAREAQELLERMEKDEAGIMSKPNDVSYNTVLRAWCTAGYPDHAESLLHRMCLQYSQEGEAEHGISPSALPTSLHFVNVMHGWACIARRRNGHNRALERVEQLLKIMHMLHARGFRTKPSLTAYNIFLECLTKSREYEAPERAESFLRLMEETGETDSSLKPDARIFNSVLTTWLRSNRSDAPERATTLFEKMKMLHVVAANIINTHTYTTLMAIYAQHSLAAKAQEVFDEMVQLTDPRIRVPFAAYTTLLHAWAIAGKPEIAFQILEQLRQEFEAGELEGPSQRSTQAFNSVLTSWSNSKRPDAAKKAESCLETMHALAASGKFDVRPDLLSYSLVIKSFLLCSHHDASHRAMRIFEMMKVLYMESGDPNICPDLKIYMDVIAVLAKSSQHSDVTSDDTSLSAPEQIHRLIDEIDSFVHPSCWHDQGELVISRMAWQVMESDFTTKEKVQLMLQLCLLADQHSVKVDRTIMMRIDQYRRLETI